ncbi:acyltransferase domain-containing protein, partial [Myxococcota bacterium]|nr:acyltransferase domain-containing protein [Myxococcota bacterium]
QAIEGCFTKPLYFGNIKPEFGYFKAANAAVALTKLVLMTSHRAILPNRSYEPRTTIIKPESVLKAATSVMDMSHKSRLTFASNVHGIGGDHGHLIVSSLPTWLTGEVSAPVPLPADPERSAAHAHRLCALLAGQGSQYPGMMRELYDADPQTRDLMDNGERIFVSERGYSLLEIMFGSDDAPLNRTENTQPAVFLATSAIYAVLKRRGVSPDCFIGHSLGEYTALHLSGAVDFASGFKIVLTRSSLMGNAARETGGAIMVLFADAEEAQKLLALSPSPDLYIANKNSDKQTAVAGKTEAVDALCSALEEAKVPFKKLALSAAFHTPLMKQCAQDLATHLADIPFAAIDFSSIISNATGKPYPNDEAAVKRLLTQQLYSPLEFTASIASVRAMGVTRFVEVGTGRILTNLLNNITMAPFTCLPSDHRTRGMAHALKEVIDAFAPLEAPSMTEHPRAGETAPMKMPLPAVSEMAYNTPQNQGFDAFCEANESSLKELMYREFLKHKQEKHVRALERFDFYVEPVVVAGVSIGLPGSGYRVFNSDNFDRILAGNNLIEPLTQSEKEAMVGVNITRVFKDASGNARFHRIENTSDVIQLAGKLGYFNLQEEYGIKYEYDITISLAMAAGIEALKDANIPLVAGFKTTSTGNRIPTGFALPKEMQDTTGVILTSLFPGFDEIIKNLSHYLHEKLSAKPYEEMEKIYHHLMTEVQDPQVKKQLTEWFFSIRETRESLGRFNFDRNLLLNIIPLGSAHFAQLIKARGPNLQTSGACASTTQAVGIAEDWIRAGRCERVIIIGGEAATNERQNPWVGSGFLAMGAATIEPLIENAAKPFDSQRNGTILGSGAVSLIVEREE